ncbi:MAG: hypothetical protein WAL71_02485 [Terriglobales bacterium]|jgi:hypothetical protein
MRRVAQLLFLVTLAAACCAASEENVEALKARLPSASTEDRAEISIRIAQIQLRAADKVYNEGRVSEGQAAVEDIVSYSEKARDAAIESKQHLKTVEIDVRKIAEKLRDIKRTLAFEDQAPVDQAIRRLEDARTALLKEMFSDKKGKK